MANTLDADLVVDRIASLNMTQLQNHVPDFGLFATDFSNDSVEVIRGAGATSTIQVPIATAAATTLTNPTDKSGGDTTVAAQPVAMNHYVQPMHLTQAQLNSGHQIDRVINISLSALLNKCWSVIATQITTANFGAAVLDKAPGTVVTDDLKTIMAEMGKFNAKNLIVDSTFFSQFAVGTNRDSFDVSMPGAYGFSAWDYASDWSDAGTNVNGFVSSTEAFAIASREAIYADQSSSVIDMASATLPNGMPVQVLIWVNPNSGQLNMTLETVFGAAPAERAKSFVPFPFMTVPAIDKSLKRGQWQRSIERDPIDAILRRANGDTLSLSVRLGSVSSTRKVNVTGLYDDTPDLQAKIILPSDEPRPEPRRDMLAIGSDEYRIVECDTMDATNCYVLTLSKLT